MKKLLIINVTANSGSTGRIAEEIGQTAISNGFDTYFAYGRLARESKCKLIKIGKKCKRCKRHSKMWITQTSKKAL